MLVKDRTEGKVLVLGHRGAPLKEIENTVASFRRAIADGADGVELDVRVTKDHKLVVSHDNLLKRVYGADLKVEESTLPEIRKVAPEVAELREVFDALGPVFYDIEIKADAPLDYNKEVVTLLGEELGRRPELREKIMLSSFNPFAMRQAQKVIRYPYPRALIYEGENIPKPCRHGLPRILFHCSVLKPKFNIATREKQSKKKYPVVPWTVDTEEVLMEMIALKSPIIITNDSEKIVRILQEQGLR
ncbi:MAG: glycerophosphodiester phosphodiesterase [Spirochaetales bacterium]|nr:glycerophosphodiester phosphodiesterase [Candidatus Physcosoma equi]